MEGFRGGRRKREEKGEEVKASGGLFGLGGIASFCLLTTLLDQNDQGRGFLVLGEKGRKSKSWGVGVPPTMITSVPCGEN